MGQIEDQKSPGGPGPGPGPGESELHPITALGPSMELRGEALVSSPVLTVYSSE